MPDSTERKRQRRAEQAAAQGKTYKPRKHPCLCEQPPPPARGSAEPQQANLTMEEELNRARMEVEDCRTRVQGLMKASASLTSFYQVWLQPKQRVRLRARHRAHAEGARPPAPAGEPDHPGALASFSSGGAAKGEAPVHRCASRGAHAVGTGAGPGTGSVLPENWK